MNRRQLVTPKITPNVMTVLEVSRYLKVHHTTVYRLLKTRRIPAFRVAGNWRFMLQDLELWIDHQNFNPPELRKRGH